MAERPKVQFAYAEDGTSLAYTVHGAGDVTILVAFSSWLTHVERDWGHPGRARLYELLGGFARVIVTDRRKMGMSDPGPASGSLEAVAGDLLAVLDASGTDRASVFSVGNPAALALAAVAPDRVERLVLYNVVPRWVASPEYPYGFSQEVLDAWLDGHQSEVAAGDSGYWADVGGLNPLDVGLSPGNSESHHRWLFAVDASDHLAHVRQPALVVRTTGAPLPAGSTDWLVQRLPDATRLDLDGPNEPYVNGDLGALAGVIEQFLTGRRTERAGERRLATVVFTDIVDSTRTAAALGAGAWREVLDAHDRITRQTVERHNGTYVKSTGDGALAVFALPDAALAALRDLHAALAAHDIVIRAGAHVGVVEDRGGDISGLAVHTAARIASVGAAGDTVVSAGVLDDAPATGWATMGAVELRGIERTWELFSTSVGR